MASSIAIIGTGYVGLTTGACFAHLGHHVVCADIDAERVATLQRGEVPIVEAGLENLVREGMSGGRLQFVVGAETAAAEAEFVYLCVPTPQAPDGSADLSYIEVAARQIAPVLQSETVVINKSTVPVGSTRVVERELGRGDVYVVSNPEFLREGSAVHDFLHPDRIVIGADDQAAAIRVASLYLGVAAPLIVTDPASAETIKYASNAFLATKISFANAIAAVCEAVGADINDVVLGMGYDKRIGQEFLRPGPGFGGSCFVGSESLLVRRAGEPTRLVTFEELFDLAGTTGVAGWEALAWVPDELGPTFLPLSTVTKRPFAGDLVQLETKMGRRVTVTADHPCIVGDGVSGDVTAVKLAAAVDTDDWLPVAQHVPVNGEAIEVEPVAWLGAAQRHLSLDDTDVIVRLSGPQREILEARRGELHHTRRRDVLRSGAMRLSELRALGIDPAGATVSTVKNGTYVPWELPLDPGFWRVMGLFLAEAHRAIDGRRHRLVWSFNPRTEQWLAELVAEYWRALGVRADVRDGTTARNVTVSSRLLASWLCDELATGHRCYGKRIPDMAWSLPREHKEALLQGLWWGDGSWSLVNGGPSAVLEYGTVSRQLADGMLRLLGELGITARLKVGRSAKSTTDAFFLVIAGADQVERCAFLARPPERLGLLTTIGRQTRRIAPTGYRPLSKNASWVRVARTRTLPFAGDVFSVEVPGAHTVVTTGGLVLHNCFPKDTRALIHIAETAGYEFGLLKGVVQVNEEQFDRVAEKVVEAAGGSIDGVRVAAWGLSFKARTDDLRESPALAVLSLLRDRGAKVTAFDPTVKAPPEARKAAQLEGIAIVDDPYSACEGAEVLLVLTEWEELKWLDFDKVAEVMPGRQVVDARNLLDREALRRRGFTYRGIGRA